MGTGGTRGRRAAQNESSPSLMREHTSCSTLQPRVESYMEELYMLGGMGILI